MRLINIKLTRGDAITIMPDQIWAEIGKVFVQRACGLQPTGPARSGKPQVNVRELVSALKGKPAGEDDCGIGVRRC